MLTETGKLHSYPKVVTLGSKGSRSILDGEVIVQEKLDGSQFSFAIDVFGDLHGRSKNRALDMDRPMDMFAKAVAGVRSIKHRICAGIVYRAEAFRAAKHNVMAYEREPRLGFVLFDYQPHGKDCARHPLEGCDLGCEIAPTLAQGKLTRDDIRQLLELQSVLGGPIEGVVIKRIESDLRDRDGKEIIAKVVRPEFKEKMTGRKGKALRDDPVTELGNQLRTEARWQKAVQHLREQGLLTETTRDIGPLIREVHRDILEEERAYMEGVLFEAFRKQVMGGTTHGFPEWYKAQLEARV